MKYVNKDLLQAFEDGDCNVILHQCNCTKGMGAGIAKKIAEKYPIVFMLDNGFRKMGMGRCLMIELDVNKILFNLYCQYYTGTPSNKHLPIMENIMKYDTFEQRIEWLRSALKEMKTYLFEKVKIGIPLIASGLAADKRLKGDMTDMEYFKKYIAPIIEEELKDLDLTVYYI